MNCFSLVGLTGMFTWNTFTGLVISVTWIKMSLSNFRWINFPKSTSGWGCEANPFFVGIWVCFSGTKKKYCTAC